MNPNYRTLNKDIGMVQRTNNGWDLWFDNGDLVKAEDFHSLQVGIIIACLTSWNYMNRYGNPTYSVFGNRAYQLLKANKGGMVQYKIEQFFLECLKRMRRVYDVVSLTVSESPYSPYTYFVDFQVISINNQLVDGSFQVSTDTSKSASYIEFEVYMPFASSTNPLQIDLYLKNEYGGGIADEIVYLYINGEFGGVYGRTDETGYLRVTYTPSVTDLNSTLQFRFNGNVNYNGVVSRVYGFKSVLFHFEVDDDGELYLVNSGSSREGFHLAEIIDTTEQSHYFFSHEKVLWDKIYLLPIGSNTYRAYRLVESNGEKAFALRDEEIMITKDFPVMTGDIHLLVETDENNYLLHTDDHLYYLGD